MAMRSLLQHSQTASAPEDMIASFFIRGRGNSLQKSELGLYRSLTHQLYKRFPEEFLDLTAFFKKKVDGCGDPGSGKWEWMPQVLLKHLSRALKTISRQSSVVIFVDALDEAGETAALTIVNAFKSTLAAANEHSHLKICFSCRHYPQITLDGGITIVMEHHNEVDVNCIIDRQLQYSGFEEWEKSRLKEVVCTKSQGIIQWATLVVRRVIGDRTHGNSFEEALEQVREVPEGLHELYVSLLPATAKTHESTREARDRKLALKLFQWVLYARSPLSAWELQQALALDYNVESKSTVGFQSGNAYIDRKDLHLKLKSLSQGLIEIKGDFETGVVQFIHQSVVDFLFNSEKALQFLSGGSGLLPARLAHFQLSRSCFRYLFMENICDILLSDSMSRQKQLFEIWRNSDPEMKDRCGTTLRHFPNLPFLLYTWQHWLFHLYYAQENSLSDFDDLDQVDLFELSQMKKSDDQEKQLQRIRGYLATLQCAGMHLPTDLNFPWAEENLLPCIFSFCGSQFQVQKLLEARLRELRKSSLQYSLLTYAIRGRQKTIAEILIQRKLGLDKGSRFSPQLELACEWGEINFVSMLLKGGWKSHRKSFFNARETPLGRAALAGHSEVMDILLGAGANINARAIKGGNTILHEVASPHIAHHLIQRGADIRCQNSSGETPLHSAVHHNNLPMIDAILKHDYLLHGVRKKPAFFSIGRSTNMLLINATDRRGWTPFATAVWRNNFDAMRALLNAGAEVDSRDADGSTPLMTTCRFWGVGVIGFLLDAGADINSRGWNNVTCLMMACEGGNVDVVRFLLESGFQDVNAATSTRETALWNPIQSYRKGHDISAKLAKSLILSGVEGNIRGRCGRTSLMMAALRGFVWICVLLLNEGADVNVEDETRRTALIYAVIGVRSRTGNFDDTYSSDRREKEELQTVELLNLLLSSGAVPNAVDVFGKNALHYAHSQQTQIIQLLRKAGLNGEPGSDDHLESDPDWYPGFLGPKRWAFGSLSVQLTGRPLVGGVNRPYRLTIFAILAIGITLVVLAGVRFCHR